MAITTAQRLINFLGNTYGLDRVQVEGEQDMREAAIDLITGAVIEVDPDSPDAETMIYVRPNGQRLQVDTAKLLKPILIRQAKLQPPTGPASDQFYYSRIVERLEQVTGICLPRHYGI